MVDFLHLPHGLMRGIHDDVIFAVKEHQGAVTHSIDAHEDKPSTIVGEREVRLAMSKRDAEIAIELRGERLTSSQRVPNRNACYWIQEFRGNRPRSAARLKRQSNDSQQDKTRRRVMGRNPGHMFGLFAQIAFASSMEMLAGQVYLERLVPKLNLGMVSVREVALRLRDVQQ